MKAVANSAVIAHKDTKAASPYIHNLVRCTGDMVLTKARTDIFAKARLAM